MTQFATAEVRECIGSGGLARFEGVHACNDVHPFAHELEPDGGWCYVGLCYGCIGNGQYLALETAVIIQ